MRAERAVGLESVLDIWDMEQDCRDGAHQDRQVEGQDWGAGWQTSMGRQGKRPGGMGRGGQDEW